MTEYVFINHKAMLDAAEREVREEARRHPDDPWTPDRDKRWAEKAHGLAVQEAPREFVAAVAEARKRLRNELLAVRFEQVEKAVNTRDHYEARGWPVPQRVWNVMAWAAMPEKITALHEFDEEDDAESVDKAVAAIKAALREPRAISAQTPAAWRGTLKD